MNVLPSLLHSPILPVVVVHSLADVQAMAEGLLAAGIKHIEITLRTPHALAAMAWVAKHQPTLVVGAGTVLNPSQAAMACDHGAQFLVSPGFSNALANSVHTNNWAWVPGVATASECIQAQEAGFQLLKFFPAQYCGGLPLLAAFGAVFQDLRFIPTGGIKPNTLADWAALPCVAGVGGTWLCAPTNTALCADAVKQHSLEAMRLWQQARP